MEARTITERKNYILRNEYPKRIRKSPNKKKNFRRDCKRFIVKDNALYFRALWNQNGVRVVSTNEKKEVIRRVHEVGHLGINKTWKALRERYYWSGSFEDVKAYVINCEKCQKKEPLAKAKKLLQSIPVPKKAFVQIGMDLIGPLPESDRGNKYILVYTEYLTKWVEAEGLPNKEAGTVAESFIKFVCTHGIPTTLITDQGREFCNELNDLICKQMGIDHRVASAYHPQTGGLTERFNRTLCTMLSTVVNDNQNNWDEKIPYVLFAYRTSEQKSTKMDPFSLVYGRKARLPVELDIPSSPQEQTDEEDNTALQARINAFIGLSESRKRANINIKKAQRKQKLYHDSHVKFSQFKVGDSVLLHNTRKTTRKGGKLESRWKGPFVIEKVLKKGVYKLHGHVPKVNGNRLKLFRGGNDKEANQKVPDRENKESHLPSKKRAKTYTNQYDENNDNKRKKVGEDDLKENSSEQQSENEQDNENSNDNLQFLHCENRNKTIPFKWIDNNWQAEKAALFGIEVKNFHKQSKPYQEVPVHSEPEPTKTIAMRGDGNCLFRAFSYILFGVQSYHVLVRDYIVNFMQNRKELFESVEATPIGTYISESLMSEVGTWGTELEILAFATMLSTTIYVYCPQGKRDGRQMRGWLPYCPLEETDTDEEGAVYLRNIYAHFEPVFGIKCEKQFMQNFPKPPYLGVKNYLQKKYWKYVSTATLYAALVNSFQDEELLHRNPACPYESVYVKQFSNEHYKVDVRLQKVVKEIDANIFNLLCDHEDLDAKLLQDLGRM